MAFLSETLGGPTPRRKRTQGKITPVPRRRNPYLGRVRDTDPARTPKANPNSNTNLLGALAQTKGQGAPVSTGMEINYESDPVLARIKALNTQNVGNAKTEAAALRKQAIIDTGFDDVGREIGLDSNTVEAAKKNPFSTRATIERTAVERGRELDDSLNQQNLYFSGYRADQLGDLARNTAEAQTRAGSSLRGLLGGIDSGVREVEERAVAEEQAALQEVAFQQQQAAMQQSYMDALASMLSGMGGGGWGDPYGGYDPYAEQAPPPLVRAGVPSYAQRTLSQTLGGSDEYALAQGLGMI